MFFADEVRPVTDELPAMPAEKSLTPRELDMATMLIESMAATWDPERYHDTHRRQVEEIIDRKRQGQEIVTESPVAPSTKVVDLMEALQASVRARSGDSGTVSGRRGTRRRRQGRPAAKRAPNPEAGAQEGPEEGRPRQEAAGGQEDGSRPPAQGLLSPASARTARPRGRGPSGAPGPGAAP